MEKALKSGEIRLETSYTVAILLILKFQGLAFLSGLMVDIILEIS